MTEPQPSDGFEWTQAARGPVLRCRPLTAFADHFFTAGQMRLREDPSEWDAVAELAGVAPRRVLRLRQVHGNTIAIVRPGDADAWTPPQADGVVGTQGSTALAVVVADCAPLLIADRRTGAVAAVHAGWRSTMQRIAARAVTVMQRDLGSDPADLIVAIGPSLGQCCGEMGEEVVAAFREAGHDEAAIERWFAREAGRRPQFDLWRSNRDQLEGAGVPAADIHVAGLCTRTHAGVFHSYRADGSAAGRMAGVIRPKGR